MSAKLAMVCGGQVFAVKKEEIGDLAVSGDETLTLPRGLEAHHAPLSSSHSKMGIFSLVVQSCPSSNDLRLFGLWKNGVSGSVCGLI